MQLQEPAVTSMVVKIKILVQVSHYNTSTNESETLHHFM